MQLAPQIELTGISTTYAEGLRGVQQTLAAMRAFVKRYRTNLQMRNAATTAIFLTPERDELSEVNALYTLVRDGVRYVRDIHDVETLSAPDKTLAGRVGDCDDKAVLLATLLESVGYPTRFVVTGYDVPGQLEHVYLQALALGQWIDLDPTEHGTLGYAPPGPVTMLIERV